MKKKKQNEVATITEDVDMLYKAVIEIYDTYIKPLRNQKFLRGLQLIFLCYFLFILSTRFKIGRYFIEIIEVYSTNSSRLISNITRRTTPIL